jgi:hypothetical protein
MLQVFHLNVTEVDLKVAYTCMLQEYVSSVSHICCKCFIRTLNMFAMTFKCFSRNFGSVLDLFASVSTVLDVCCKFFIRVLQKYIWCYTCCNGTHLP